jgi:hypothetical protein
MANATRQEVTGWVGWIYFAGFMMLLIGFFQAVIGLTALLNDKYFVSLHGRLLVWNFTGWGWIHLIFGIVVLLAGMNLFTGSTWSRVVATILVTVNLMTQFVFVSVYPVWSIIMMVIDVLVLYALTIHGSEARVAV